MEQKQTEATNAGGNILHRKEKRTTLQKDKSKPFAHPYYWSPFVLYGNWK